MWKPVIASKPSLIKAVPCFWNRPICVDGVDDRCMDVEHL